MKYFIFQFEIKLQNMINQKLVWHEHDKRIFTIQIRELQETLSITQQNLTDTVQQVKGERIFL